MNTDKSAPSLLLSGGNEPFDFKHDLLTTPLRWRGDDISKLPKRTGEVPTGYNAAPEFRIFRKEVHSVGYLSYGPYYEVQSPSELRKLFILCAVDNLGRSDELIAKFDLVDAGNGGKDIVGPVEVKVGDLHGIRVFGIYLPRPVGLNQGMNVECRIYAHGGADLYFLQMYWDISGM